MRGAARFKVGMAWQVLLAFAVLILALAAYSAWSYRQSLEERRSGALDETVQFAQTTAAVVNGLLSNLDTTTLAMSAALGTQPRPIDQELVGPYLQAVMQQYSFVRAFFVMDPYGRVVASPSGQNIGVDLSEQPYTRALLGGDEVVLTDAIPGTETGAPVVVMARTIRSSEGELRGLLAAAFYPERLAEVFPGSVPADASLSVYDHKGGLLYSSIGQSTGTDQAEGESARWVRNALAGMVVRVPSTTAAGDDRERLAAFVPVPRYGWAVSSTRTADAVVEPLERLYRRQLLVLGLITGGALVLAFILSRALSRPLTRLAEQARAFGRGDRGVTAIPSGPAEVQELAMSFNAMAGEVRQRFAERAAAEQRLAFLAEASAVLASSLDYEATLQQIARLSVPALADWCAVDIVEGEGTMQRLAVAATDPEMEALLRRLRREYPFDPEGPHPIATVLRTGEALLEPKVPDELLAAIAHDPEHLRLLRSVGTSSRLTAPLAVRGQPIGALTLGRMQPNRPYGPDDLALAGELGRRAAIAIENARLYQEAQAALGDATDALAVREQFLSLAAHELRTPLTALKGQVQLAQRRTAASGDPQVSALLRRADHQVDRLTLLVADLLDVSRIAAGRLSIETEPIALTPLVEGIVELQREATPPRTIVVDAPEASPLIEADAARLEQVLVNLLENARKYSPPDTPIRVSIGGDPEFATFTVQDEGVGIPEEEQDRIFERFHRASNVNANVAGLGLGLYISHEIVRAHGGSLNVVSAPGRGSTFSVRIPRKTAPPSPSLRADPSPLGVPGERGA